MSLAMTHGSPRDIRQSRRHPWIANVKFDRPSMNTVEEEPRGPLVVVEPSTTMQRIRARNDDGLIVFTGLNQNRAGFQSIGPVVEENDHIQLRPQHNSRNVPSVALSFVESRSPSPEIEEDGPNANGTYSREYTLRHPDITWVHRGQGRYRPESAIAEQSQKTPSSSQDQDLLVPELRKSLRSRVSTSEDGHPDRSEPKRLSPRATRLSDSTYSLRRQQSDQSPNAAELREARLLRRTLPSSGESQSTDTIDDEDDDDDDDDDEEEDKTYGKSYVEAHPEAQFRHCGNGFYRRVSGSQPEAESRVTRRTSGRSSTKLDASPIDSTTLTIHSSELKNFPGEKFRHCGNGYYRRESAISQNTSTSSAAITERSVSPIDMAETFSKEEMLAAKAAYPDVTFIHRGNGRYKRADDVANEATIAASDAQSKITYNKDYVDSHPEESFYHTGCGRYKKGVRSARTSMISSDGNGNELPTGLVTKQYVEEHPELVFHHRGQGRWALGPRPTASSKSRSPVEEEPKLVDRDYVDAHPEETFHHRGQGRWAKGPPPPGSSNKMAVRGPVVQEQRDTAVFTAEAETADDSDAPGLFDLVRRDEGPDAFPHLQWFYRGGGKWARVPKDAADAHERAAQKAKAPAHSRSELGLSTDADDVTSSRRYGQQTSARPTLKRKHSTLQSSNTQDKDSQSKDSTPRPRMLTLEEDQLGDEDLPELYADEWPPSAAEEDNDEAAQIIRQNFRPMNDVAAFINSMTKLDLSTRPMENLLKIAEHVQQAMQLMQDEYLELDKVTAPHARIPRKVATGGRLPVEPQVFEDRKEADLYDYQFDPKKIGYQDPELQKITRDVDGRELRKRRKRGELDPETNPTEAPLSRRTIKPVERFEGVPGSTRRSRTTDVNKQGSLTPDRIATPEKIKTTPDVNAWADNYVAPKSGRWANHIPKRIKELRGSNMGLSRLEIAEEAASADEDESSSTKTTPTKLTSNIIASIEDEMEVDEE